MTTLSSKERRSRETRPTEADRGAGARALSKGGDAILTKTTRPASQNSYPREKFFEILDKCRERPVIWLAAPPGAGKTTLISSYVGARGQRCLWYQMDSGDRDLATFFHYLGAAASGTGPGQKKILPDLTPEYQAGIRSFTREYFAKLYRLLGRGSLLVFDNYQEVAAESVLHEALYDGLSDVPAGLNVVIISRSLPPPPLSRMRPARSMEVLTWDELKLTADEVRGIASKSGMKVATDKEAHDLLLRVDGWAAGLLLVSECVSADFSRRPVNPNDPGAVFEYFSCSLFKKLDNATRDFLLKSSVLPSMTPETAGELTGSVHASGILSELVRKNYFTQRHDSEGTRYQYHPLFREFLLSSLSADLEPGKLAALELKAAALLAENDQPDSAIELFRKNADWESIVSLIHGKAAGMLASGRHSTLTEWIGLLPAGYPDSDPWIMYWKGCCRLPFDQAESRLCFKTAYDVFYAKKDPAGVFLSWSGVVDATIHEFEDLTVLDSWIDSLDGLLAEFPAFPSPEIENRVTLSMFTALSFRAPWHPDISLWAERTYALLEKIPDPDIGTLVSLFLVDYFIWTGEMERAGLLVERLKSAEGRKHYGPMALIASKLAEALNGWYNGRQDECVKAVEEGLATAEKEGIRTFNYFLYGHGAVGSLTSGDLKTAEEYLAKASSVLDEKKPFCASYYHHISACHRLLKKDLSGALEHERLALSLAVRSGTLFGEAMSLTGMALLHHELGDREKAAAEIEDALRLAERTKSGLVEFVCHIFAAYFALQGGDRKTAVERLKDAMSLGSRKGLVNFHMWVPEIMTQLCLLSLAEGIEPEYAIRLVRERGLWPEEPPLEVEAWPWRMKVHVFGRFSVTRDGSPLRFNKKTPKKPIELLNLLVSLGGTDVPEGKIADTLWRHSEGDTAHITFTTTLHRLRQLLGVDDALVLANGRLSLNPRYCWVDVFAFERLVTLAEDSCGDRSAAYLKRAVEMYGAGFDVNNAEKDYRVQHWRERIKNKFIRSVLKLGAFLEKGGRVEEAIECYELGIETEFLSEEVYQRLMRCLAENGRKAEALILYGRLKKTLKDALGMEPSAATEEIYEGLA